MVTLTKARSFLMAALALSGVGYSQTADGPAPPHAEPQPAPKVGDEFRPQIGQPVTADIVARQVTVTWSDRDCPFVVFFDRNSREVLVGALVTNRLCCLNGRVYWVDPVGQALSVRRSKNIGTNELTAEIAIELALKTFHGGVVGHETRVDLRPLLKREEDEFNARHLSSFLGVPRAEIRVAGGNLRADFKSATGYLGTVLLTPDLVVLATNLTGYAKWTAEDFRALGIAPPKN